MWDYVGKKYFPEKMLWLAVMRRAIFDYVLYRGVGAWSLEWKRSKQFLFNENVKCENGLNCEEICGVFGWDLEYIRSLIKRLNRADVRKLESNKFKEEFFIDSLSVVIESFVRWDTAPGAVAPFLENRRYAAEYRSLVKTKTVPLYGLAVARPPIIHWAAAA